MDELRKTRLKRRLLKEREWIWSQLDATNDSSASTTFAQATPTVSQEDDLFEQLQLVNFALRRIAVDTYGTCLRCGKEIPLERLETSPSACLCSDCQFAKETAIKHGRLVRHTAPI